jgi:hypothetical protein
MPGSGWPRAVITLDDRHVGNAALSLILVRIGGSTRRSPRGRMERAQTTILKASDSHPWKHPRQVCLAGKRKPIPHRSPYRQRPFRGYRNGVLIVSVQNLQQFRSRSIPAIFARVGQPQFPVSCAQILVA